MKRYFAVLPAGLLGLIAFAAPACAQDAPPVVVWSSRHQVEDNAVYTAFTGATGIKVEVVDGEFDELLQRLKTQGKAAGADLLVSSGAASLWQTAEAGLLQPLPPGTIDPAVPRDFRDPSDRWVGLSYWARIVAYHKDRVDPADVATYEGLADPKLHGKIAVRSASSPYNIALIAALIDADGTEATEDWARGLVANFARPPQGGDSNQLEALAAGDADIAIVNTRFWARFAASDKVTETEIVANLGAAFPNQAARGTAIDLAGAGLLKDAPHPKSAEALVAFLLRPEIQAKFAGADFEYPVRPDVPPVPVLAGLGPFKADTAALGKLGKFAPEAERVMARAGWE